MKKFDTVEQALEELKRGKIVKMKGILSARQSLQRQ